MDDGIALGIERDGADGRPVARVMIASLAVQRMTLLRDRVVGAGMPLRGADITATAMPMVMVVPAYE